MFPHICLQSISHSKGNETERDSLFGVEPAIMDVELQFQAQQNFQSEAVTRNSIVSITYKILYRYSLT